MNIEDLNIRYLNKIIKLQTAVYTSLDNKAQLETLSREEFEVVLSQGYAAGIIIDGDIVAFRAFLIPDDKDAEHLALDVNLATVNSIYSEVSLVHPNHRGQGMQTKMGEYLLKKVEESGRYKYVLATVAPDNLPSLIDKFRLGFVIAQTKFKYQHKLRHILLKEVKHASNLESDEITYVPYNDTEWILNNGSNFIGIGLRKHDIMYIRKQ